MARTVRIAISRALDALMRLGNKLVERHAELGNESPVQGFNIETIHERITTAEAHLKKARKLHSEAEGETEKAYLLLGLGKGQTIKRPKDTVYFISGKVRNQLKVTHEGEEEQISKYGYNVVIS